MALFSIIVVLCLLFIKSNQISSYKTVGFLSDLENNLQDATCNNSFEFYSKLISHRDQTAPVTITNQPARSNMSLSTDGITKFIYRGFLKAAQMVESLVIPGFGGDVSILHFEFSHIEVSHFNIPSFKIKLSNDSIPEGQLENASLGIQADYKINLKIPPYLSLENQITIEIPSVNFYSGFEFGIQDDDVCANHMKFNLPNFVASFANIQIDLHAGGIVDAIIQLIVPVIQSIFEKTFVDFFFNILIDVGNNIFMTDPLTKSYNYFEEFYADERFTHFKFSDNFMTMDQSGQCGVYTKEEKMHYRDNAYPDNILVSELPDTHDEKKKYLSLVPVSWPNGGVLSPSCDMGWSFHYESLNMYFDLIYNYISSMWTGNLSETSSTVSSMPNELKDSEFSIKSLKSVFGEKNYADYLNRLGISEQYSLIYKIKVIERPESTTVGPAGIYTTIKFQIETLATYQLHTVSIYTTELETSYSLSMNPYIFTKNDKNKSQPAILKLILNFYKIEDFKIISINEKIADATINMQYLQFLYYVMNKYNIIPYANKYCDNNEIGLQISNFPMFDKKDLIKLLYVPKYGFFTTCINFM